ncbi:MAG: flagellar biosynthetic protein FliQ [Proteobacteria bacterium]|nr:flagellar biosynthetic protein FliQ [Pseudomonadota bacterium]
MVEILFRESLLKVSIISGIPLLGCVVVGLTISLLQAATQVQEQSVGFLMKFLVVCGTFALCGNWFGAELLKFVEACLAALQQVR